MVKDEQTFFVVSSTYADYAESADGVAESLQEAGFGVLRIPLPCLTDDDMLGISWRTYTHALFVGDEILIPGFGRADDAEQLAQDQDILHTLQEAFVGYDVKLVEWPSASAEGPRYVTKPVPHRP